ncbi:MAG: PKD domain-containing protein [bacterium]
MKRFFALAIVLGLLVALVGCTSSKDGDDNGTDPPDGLQTQSVQGSVDLPAGSPLDPGAMQINSPLGQSAVGADKGFTVNAPVATNYQLMMAIGQGGKAAMLGLLQPGSATGSLGISAGSTSKSLILMSPFFARASSSDKQTILNQLTGRSDVAQLEDFVKDLLVNDPEGTLDYSKHPRIYEEASKIAIDYLKSKGTNSGDDPATKKPTIEDATGTGIKFSNPGAVFYAAGIYESGSTTPRSIKLIESDDTKSDFLMGWPPRLATQATKTDYTLGDGTFDVKVTRGFDFTEGSGIINSSTAEGLATIANIGKAIIDMNESVTGYKFDVDLNDLSLYVSSSQATKLSDGMRQQDGWKVAEAMTEVIESNKEAINTWLWEDGSTSAGKDFVSRSQGLVKHITTVVKIVGSDEPDLKKGTPFFYDLAASTQSTKYTVIQANGVVTTNVENESPGKPSFVNAPTAGAVGSAISFTVMGSDPESDNVSFRLQWGDGTNSNWTEPAGSGGSKTLTHSYTTAGTYIVTVQAKDSYGSISTPSEGKQIIVAPSGSTLYDTFDDDQVGGLPSDPPWNVLYTEPSYCRISSSVYYGSSGNSCGFFDYDADIQDVDSTASVQIYAATEDAASGSLEFVWRVKALEDGFGLRSYGDPYDFWNTVGYYVLFQGGELKYSTSAQTFVSLQAIQVDTWYRMKLDYDRVSKTYDIYVNGVMKAEGVSFYGNPTALNWLQILAFSDETCREAYIDNVNLSTGAALVPAPKLTPEQQAAMTASRPPLETQR